MDVAMDMVLEELEVYCLSNGYGYGYGSLN
jgi:hypothetical protein